MMRTNRGLLNEFLWGRWCLFKALCVSMVTWRVVTTEWNGDQLVSVNRGDKLYYEYGRE